ncbi:hypothetical protein DUNSADRAFT_13293 [Dunaliella salina]|uniref:Ribulose bisphosphate carboxylase/oxygenase activase, chloroplastic n=1 Tax=Dunaliella salina TaxID=3046 RepID=A0ABQ7G9P5_DUNSA|nr:hypothetical protein DUNSADRAFT_13293 [Dunaliella salina]|eukprot:KAF5831319.1 hypothetical protein DUNSADRAFT_13293 [Dunaliella salina]
MLHHQQKCLLQADPVNANGRLHSRLGIWCRPCRRRLAYAQAAEMSWEDKMALEKLEAQKREEQAIEERKAREWAREKARQRGLMSSSWAAKEAGGGRGGGADYLYELGKKSFQNTNVDAGQNVSMIDGLFTGGYLGSQSDIADGSLRNEEFRTFNHFVGDYYVAPAFLEKVAIHIAKNYMADLGIIDKKVKVPLILGIWGEKGMGKTFQTELALKKLGAEAVVMSAGELEHEWAGTPGKLIRERYKKVRKHVTENRQKQENREKSKYVGIKANLPGGATIRQTRLEQHLGHFADTQVTVNNQMVIGTLMNLCDHPNTVSVGGDWKEGNSVRRTPIIVTGNDFTKMFAPLIRDGRFEKFMWKPSIDDLVNIVHSMYQDDGLSMDDVYTLIKRFPKQPLDFFGALRASQYDNQIRAWIEREVLGGMRT